MIYYLEIKIWDNVIDGVYSENRKFLTIVHLRYCNILSSSHIVLSSKSHGVYEFISNKVPHTHTHTIIILINILIWFFEFINLS